MITHVPVIGTFRYRDATETPASGQRVVFIARNPAVVDGQVITLPKKLTATLTAAGALPAGFTLPTVAGGLYYIVRESFSGARDDYTIQVLPTDTQIDLATATQVVPIDPMAAYLTSADIGVNVASQAAATSLDARVDALEASPGGGAWGTITGTLAAQTDLQAALDGKATAAQGAKADTALQFETDPTVPAWAKAPTKPSYTAGEVGADASGTAASAVTAHVAASDPHPQYTTTSEAAAAAPVQSVAGKTGAVSLAAADIGGLGTAATQAAGAFATAAQGTKADSAIQPGNAALSDAREWTAATATQAEAEAGTDTARKAWSVLRVWQAIAAWWAASAAKSKLDGIAAGATVGADWATNVNNKPTLGNSAALNVGTTAGTVAAGNDARLSDARTPTAHTHTAAQISDSTAVGRSVVTATDAAAARSAIGALATTGGTMTGAITGNVGGGTEFTQMKVDGSTFSEPVQDFMFAGRLFSGVNLPGGSSLPNCVYNIGWGVGANGAPLVAGQPALRIAFEQNFINPGSVAAYEWHLSYYDTTGYEHRPISTYLRKDGSRGSDMSLSNDILGFNDGRYVQKIKYDLLTNIIDHFGGMTYRFDVNNYPAFKQMNAAGNGYVNLPYVGTDNRLRMESPVVFVGAIPTTGSYSNTFAAFQAIGVKNNDSILDTIVGNLTGSVYSIRSVNECTQDAIIAHWNNTNSASSNALIQIRTISGTAGDPFVRYTVNGGEDWAVGVDNSDDDAFVCSQWVPGTDNRLRLSRAGNLSVKSTIATGKFVVASLPTGSEGMTAYASNGRKQGEGSGAGTGVPVYFSATKWRRYSDDTEVVA